MPNTKKSNSPTANENIETSDSSESDTVKASDSTESSPKKITISNYEDKEQTTPSEQEDEVIKNIPVEDEPADQGSVTEDAPEVALSDEEVESARVEDKPSYVSEDDLLAQASEQTKAEDDDNPPPAPEKSRRTLKSLLLAWWHNKFARNLTILAVLVLIVAGALVPSSRYYTLNKVGVRAAMSTVVRDESTQQPLKNVQVSIGGRSGQTDSEGKVSLNRIKLGANELVVQKRAFAEVHKKVVIGWGSNPLDDIKLTPVGNQYSFLVTDFLSGKPVAKVEAVSGEASALSDENGKIKLTIDKTEDRDFDVVLTGSGYREETVTVGNDTKSEHKVLLVSARKHVFISKRSGKYDVYKIDVDGKNEVRILEGTGSERDDMVLVTHPSSEVAALVSTRENKRNNQGYLLSTLTLIDLSTNVSTEVGRSEKVQIVDWVGSRLVYVQIAAGASASDAKRHRLMSYDVKEDSIKELAASNYFNDIVIAGGVIYYAPSSAYQSGDTANFYKINADGSNKQTILAEETWNVFRTSYDHLVLALQGQWYEYVLGSDKSTKLGSEPASLTSRVYVDSPDGSKSLWVDKRDGKGVLLSLDIKGGQETVLQTQSGLKIPIRWLNNKSVIYRVTTEQETADYALSLDGGPPRKIRDVSNTGGIDRWYYY